MVLEEFPSLAGISLSFTKHCKLNYDALHTFRPLPVPGSAQGPCYDDLIQLFYSFGVAAPICLVRNFHALMSQNSYYDCLWIKFKMPSICFFCEASCTHGPISIAWHKSACVLLLLRWPSKEIIRECPFSCIAFFLSGSWGRQLGLEFLCPRVPGSPYVPTLTHPSEMVGMRHLVCVQNVCAGHCSPSVFQ